MPQSPPFALPPSLRPGEPAPDFTLPAIHQEGSVSLADYRGRAPLLLALFRGLYCPFCRRAIAQLGMTREKLRGLGVETLAVVATEAERARLYFRYRPTRLPLAADPKLSLLRAFRLPKPEVTPELMESMRSVKTDVKGELPQPMPLLDAVNALDEKDRFEFTPADNQEMEQQFPQMVGQFLLDKDGVIRWVNIEGAEGLAGVGNFPSDEEFLAAAAAVAPRA
jgi:peroxiredoxin